MKSIITAYKRMQAPTDSVLMETTVPPHLHERVFDWDHHSKVDSATKQKIHAALGGSTFVHFPLNESAHPDPEVHEHLVNHGYRIEDYKEGLASKVVQVGAPERGIPLRTKKVVKRIGSVIAETAAPEHVKKAYENDPARASAKQSDLHCVISTSPLAIAGMTTGTRWQLESCMNMETGSHSNHLSTDSAHGTHVAYLVHRDDVNAFKHGEPDNPIGRVLLKAFKSENNTDTIYRPEGKSYGAAGAAFAGHVAEWAQEKYPAKPGEVYEKHHALYDDDNNTLYSELTHDGLDKFIQNGTSKNSIVLPRHKIDYVMDGVRSGKITAPDRVSLINNLNPSDVKELTNKFGLDALATHHGSKYTEHMINTFVSQMPPSTLSLGNRLPKAILMSPKLPSTVVDALHPNAYRYVRRGKLNVTHLENAMDRMSFAGIDATQHLAKHEHLVTMARKKLISSVDAGTHSALTKETHDEFLTPNDREILRTSKFSTIDDISRPADIIRLGRNNNIDHSTPHLKDIFMSHVKSSKVGDSMSDIFGGIGTNGEVPENISRNMTHDDFDTMAKHRIETMFTNPTHHRAYVERAVANAHLGDPHGAHAIRSLLDFKDMHHSPGNKETGKFIAAKARELLPYQNELTEDYGRYFDSLHKQFANY